jgi:hypothetical protein
MTEVRKTGKPPELMQDDCRELSLWLSTRPDARWRFVQMMKERK